MAWITAPLNAGPIIGNSYNYTIPGLSANTIYEYRAYMIVGGIEYTGQTYQINTLPPTQVPPTVITGTVDIVNPYSVNINNNNLVSGGTKPIIWRGIVWGTSPNPTLPTPYGNSDGLTTLGTFSLNMSNEDYPSLEPNTTYYVRAVAESYNVNGGFTSYGAECVVQTPPLPAKHVNMLLYGSAGSEGGYYNYKCHCISNTTITPAPVAGECFCICLGLPLYVNSALLADGGLSCSSYCVYCNNVLYYSTPPNPAACDLYSQVCSPDTSSYKDFVFRSGDIIKILQKAVTKSSSYGNGGTNSCACIKGISTISGGGSFDIGTTCCKSCAWSG